MKNHLTLLATLLLSPSIQAEPAYPRIEREYTTQTTMLNGDQLPKADFDLDKALVHHTSQVHMKQSKDGAFFQIIMEPKKYQYANNKKMSDATLRSTHDDDEHFYCVFKHNKREFACTDANEPVTMLGEVLPTGNLEITYVESGLHNDHQNHPFSIGTFIYTPKR